MSDNDRKMSAEEIRHIAEAMVEELRECEDGYVTTTGRLASAYGYSEEELGFFGLFDLNDALFRAAKANHITLDMSSHEGKVEGLPFNLDFVVHNKRAQIKCPHCGSKNTARYLYGYPAYDEEMERKLDAGKIKLGGCCISEADPSRYCNDCKKDFGTPPIFLKRNDQIYEDYREEVRDVKFSIGGFFGGYEEIEIKDEGDEGVWVYVRDLPYGEPRPEPRKLRPDKWRKIIHTLYDILYVHEWKKKYVDPGVLDGTQWDLEIKLSGNRKRTVYGSNAYPPYFKELKKLFKEFTKPPRK